MLVGDSTQTLNELAKDIVPMLARRKELRDVRVDSGDHNSELTVRVDRERGAVRLQCEPGGDLRGPGPARRAAA